MAACGVFRQGDAFYSGALVRGLLRAGELAADEVALGEGTAVAVTRDVDGVVDGVGVAAGIADGVQAGDGVARGVETLQVGVDLGAADDLEQNRADLGGVERRLVDGVKQRGVLS